jgi:hypothetical protein
VTAALAVAGLAVLPSAAQAAPGDTANICASVSTPSGWVDISWYYSSACGAGSFSNNTHTIKRVF